MYRELKGVSQFIDYHLQPYVEILPSFIKDTMDFLVKTQSKQIEELVGNTTCLLFIYIYPS